jgi:CubicO group peptidase (beta-lactamase class C family)
VHLGSQKSQVIGSKGIYAWGGMASTAFWMDPLEELVVIFMTQFMPSGINQIAVQKHGSANPHSRSTDSGYDGVFCTADRLQKGIQRRWFVVGFKGSEISEIIPAVKHVRLPRMKVTCTDSSVSARLNASAIVAYMALVMAFRFSGQSIIIDKILSLDSTRTKGVW